MSIQASHVLFDVGNLTKIEKSEHKGIENGEHMRGRTLANLAGIFGKSAIAAVMQTIFNGTITNDKFCMSRVKPLPFVSARPRGNEKVEYPCGRNAGARSSQEESNDQTTVEYSARQH